MAWSLGNFIDNMTKRYTDSGILLEFTLQERQDGGFDVRDVGVVPIVSVNSEGRQELRYHEIDFVVNRAPGKLYIQSAFAMPTQDKNDQELLPLRRSGDFFRKMVVTADYSSPRVSDEGIVHVGVIPFLLDASILDNALKE